jgi:DNA polymerase-1
MRILQTETLADELADAPPDVHLWVYNAFDVMMPLEIHKEVAKKMSPNQLAFYDFERNLQGPALSMMLNGVKTDESYRLAVIAEQEGKAAILTRYVNQLATAWWGRGINVGSHIQVKQFFYFDEDGFQLKPKFTGSGSKRRITTDRKALEKIAQENYYAKPIVTAILALKEITTALEFLQRGVEPNGRVHCSYNVAATESGRWSSSHNPWRRGGNFQNQSEDIRRIYVADDGWVFAYPDLAQAEARGVAYYSGDRSYIKAVESGDLHTEVAKLVWPKLGWTGDPVLDRSYAETPFYRHLTYRDLAKRGAHGSNYGGMAATLARHLNVPEARAEEFQHRYFAAFPGIRGWHHEVQRELQSKGRLTTALGRERIFFARLDSRETLKEALAWYPQSLISDILKIGMLKVWRRFELALGLVKLHADMHDGILLSIRTKYLDDIAPQIKELMTIPIQFPTGVMTLPVDFTVGYQWQKKKMLEWTPGVLSQLTRPEPQDLLDIEAGLIAETR